MYQIKVKIKFIAPFLFNRPVDVEGTGGRKTKKQREKEALERVHRAEDGELHIPAWNFKQCLKEGANRAGLKVGRKALSAFLEAVVFVDGIIGFGTNKHDFMHEHFGKVPPRTGAGIIIKRPAMNEGRELGFTLSIIDDRRTPAEIKQSLEEAGLLVGLGAWRPHYGRFLVTEFEPVIKPG